MRMSNDAEHSREQIENTVALLVGARRRIELANLRIRQAAVSHPDLLNPALNELMEALWKICEAQIVSTKYLAQKKPLRKQGQNQQTTKGL